MIGPGTPKIPISIINNLGYAYLSPTKRFAIDPDTGIPISQKLVEDLWQPGSFKAGPETFWLGFVGVAGLGRHLVTEAPSGRFYFHAFSEYDGEISIKDAKIINVYQFIEKLIYQPDSSGSWTGTNYEFISPAPAHTIVTKGYLKTDTVAATKPVRIQTWIGTDDTGSLIFDQWYPISNFPASSEITIEYDGALEFEKDNNYFTRYSSEEDFSMKMNAAETFPWVATDIGMVREENLLQTMDYIDGENYDEDQYLIKNRQIYICNTDGVQTGTFEDNSALWDESSKRYIEGKFTETAIPYANAVGKLTEAPTDLFYDSFNYLHSPKLAVFDDDPILKRGHGLAIIRGSDDDVDILHVNTQSTSSYFRYDFSEDAFTFDKNVMINGVSVLTVETDPVFLAWDKSTGIIITESQISDLNHFNGMFGALSGTTQYRVPFGNASGGLIDSPNLMYSDSALRIGNGGIYIDRLDADSYLVFKRSGVQVGQIRGADGSIDITESGGSPVHLSVDVVSGITTMTGVNTSKIGNSVGILKLNPDATGIVELFGDADVDNSENGKMLYVWRRAPEGDDYLRFYISDNRVGVVSAPLDLTVYGGESVTLQSAGKDVIFRVGDDAGAKGTYFKNSSNAIVGSVDSLGNAQFNVSIDVPEISNTLGLLKIQPDVQGDVEVFGDTDVGNDENSKIFKIWRRAPEGNEYIRFYIAASQKAYIHTSCPMTLQAQVDFTINSVTEDIIFKVGDNAGVKKFYFKDSDGTIVVNIDSNGNLWCNEIETVNGIKAGGDLETDAKALIGGDVEIGGKLGIGKTPIDYPIEMLSTAPGIKLENSRTIIGMGYEIGSLAFNAGENVHEDVARIRVNATENWTDTSSPTKMAFYITPVGATHGQQAVLIDENSNVEIEGTLKIVSMPTSDPSISGALWNDGGNVKISA